MTSSTKDQPGPFDATWTAHPAKPFIVPLTHHGSAPLGLVEAAIAPFASYAQQGGANRPVDEPLHTVTASDGDHNCIAAAHLVHLGNGEREGQAPRAMDAEKPLNTVVGSAKHAIVAAFLERQFGRSMGASVEQPMPTTTAGGGGKTAIVFAHIEQANGGPNNETLAGRSAADPLSTIATTTGSQQRLVTSNLVRLRGTCKDGSPVDEPLHTVSAGGTHMAEVRAFLIKYYGTAQAGHGLDRPIGTVTVQDRFGLVTVRIANEAGDLEEYVIVDIGLRMLTPRELFNAQGFPPDYIIDRDITGAPITKTAQVAKCGNSVCPPLAEALVRANLPDQCRATQSIAA